jgi:hypothetical protein
MNCQRKLSFPCNFRTIDFDFAYAPHIAEELWSQLGTGSIATVAFPVFDQNIW